jgi:hypothetical protein
MVRECLFLYELHNEKLICHTQIATHKGISMKNRKKYDMSSERKKVIQNPLLN